MRIQSFFARSLRNRLILYFTVLMMVPLSLVGYFIYSASDSRIFDNALELAAQIVEKDCESVDQALTDMQDILHVIGADETIQRILERPRETWLEKERAASDLNGRLKQIAGQYQNLNGIYIVLDDGMIAKSRYYSIRKELLLSEEQYRTIRNRATLQWFASEQGSLIADNLNDAVLSAASTVSERSSGQPCGIAVVEVRQSYLNKLMSADLGRKGTIFLMDPADDALLLHSVKADEEIVADAAARAKELAVGMKIERVALKDRFLLCDRVSATGWIVVGVVFKDVLRNDSHGVFMVFVLAALLTFLLNLFVSRLLSDYELKPINRIQEYVLHVENGEFGLPLPPERPDEIGGLMVSVQEMSGKIGQLLETVKIEQERMRDAEFKALQAQINPHFLYNSLDSINWLARRGDVQKTTEMITALTTFFRIGLSKGRDMITIREELEHVQSYLVIQKIRYESQFEYSVYVDPSVENCVVPKLMLQPLVENALYHGIKLCDRKCLLMIQVLPREDQIEIEVLDNGAGMDEDTLQALREAMEHSGQNRANSYGVVNVNDRIRILAGPQYGLRFISEKDVGTSVRIILPKTL